MTTAPCDDCGKPTPVPEDWPLDWAICPEHRKDYELVRRDDERLQPEWMIVVEDADEWEGRSDMLDDGRLRHQGDS